MISEKARDKAAADLAEIEKILASDDRFFCKTYRCNMEKSDCIKRQQTTAGYLKAVKAGTGVSKFYGKPGFSDINCRNCEQGREIMNSLKSELTDQKSEAKDKKPVDIDALIDKICQEEGIDRKFLYSRTYNKKKIRPLKIRLAKELSKQGFKDKEIAPKIGCGQGSVWAYKTDAIAGTSVKKSKKNTVESKSKAVTSEEKNTLTIDFSEHIHTLESIKKIAKSEIRTPENQVLYWLSTFSVIIKKEEEDEQ